MNNSIRYSSVQDKLIFKSNLHIFTEMYLSMSVYLAPDFVVETPKLWQYLATFCPSVLKCLFWRRRPGLKIFSSRLLRIAKRLLNIGIVSESLRQSRGANFTNVQTARRVLRNDLIIMTLVQCVVFLIFNIFCKYYD